MRRPHRRATGRIGNEQDTLQPYVKKNGMEQVSQKFIDTWGTEAYKEYDKGVVSFYGKRGKRKYF